MLRKLSHVIFGLIALLLASAGQAIGQNLNGEVIQVAADALTVLKFNSEIKRYELGDRNGYTCQVRDNDNSVVIKTLSDSCGATNLIVTEGKRSHYFIIHFLKDIDINKTKLFYDYSDLKELKRLVSSGETLASNTKDDTKEDKKEKKLRKKEKEELEAKAREAEWLAQDQKQKEQAALAANSDIKEQEAVASAAEPAGKKNKKSDKAKGQEPVKAKAEEPKAATANNGNAATVKEEPVASVQEPVAKKSKKEPKAKAKQEPKEEPAVVANTITVQADTTKEQGGQAVASAQEPTKKKKKETKAKVKQAEPVVAANTVTVQDNTKKEESVADTQETGKKGKKDAKAKAKPAEPKEEPVVAANTVPVPDNAKKEEAVAETQETGKKGKKDTKGKVKPGEPNEQPAVAAATGSDTGKHADEPVASAQPKKNKKEAKPKAKEPKEEPVAAMAKAELGKKAEQPARHDAKQDSIAQAKLELQKLIAKEKERQALLKKYPNINFAEPPDGQMLTGDFFVPTDTAENYAVSTEILKKEAGKLNITSTNDKGLEVTLQDISFSGVNAYMRLLIRNKGKNEVPVGKMNVQWNKNGGGNSYNLFACYVSSFPIIPPGKEVTIVYCTRAVNANNEDGFIFTMNDRQDKFSTSLSFGGDVYNTAMGWKP